MFFVSCGFGAESLVAESADDSDVAWVVGSAVGVGDDVVGFWAVGLA